MGNPAGGNALGDGHGHGAPASGAANVIHLPQNCMTQTTFFFKYSPYPQPPHALLMSMEMPTLFGDLKE